MRMFYQQFLSFFLIIAITLLILGVTFLGLSRSMFYQDTWDLLEDYAYGVRTQAIDVKKSNGTTKIVVDKKRLNIVEEMLSSRHIKIRIYTGKDKILYPSKSKQTINKKRWNELKAGQSIRVKSNSQRFRFKAVDSPKETTSIYVPYLDINGKLLAVVSVGTVMDNIEDNLTDIKRNLLYSFFTAVVLGTIASFILTRYFTNRITRLQKATRQVADGDFDVHITTGHRDELDDLAEDFNLMTEALKESRIEFDRQEERRRNFMTNADHEMRTPLTTIKGILEGMAYGLFEDEAECKESIDLMRKETSRLIRLVNDNLDYEKSQAGELVLQKENLDASSIIRDVLRQMNDMAQKEGDRFENKLPLVLGVYADYDRFIQIITNIIKNAIQFTDNGVITIRGKKAGNNTIIQISDTGIGMTESQMAKIWDRYYKADQSRKVAKFGESGIGLSIVYQLLKLHKADVNVSSEPGVGTTFTLTFKGQE